MKQPTGFQVVCDLFFRESSQGLCTRWAMSGEWGDPIAAADAHRPTPTPCHIHTTTPQGTASRVCKLTQLQQSRRHQRGRCRPWQVWVSASHRERPGSALMSAPYGRSLSLFESTHTRQGSSLAASLAPRWCHEHTGEAPQHFPQAPRDA